MLVRRWWWTGVNAGSGVEGYIGPIRRGAHRCRWRCLPGETDTQQETQPWAVALAESSPPAIRRLPPRPPCLPPPDTLPHGAVCCVCIACVLGAHLRTVPATAARPSLQGTWRPRDELLSRRRGVQPGRPSDAPQLLDPGPVCHRLLNIATRPPTHTAPFTPRPPTHGSA